jgi:hypothetical protein
MKVQYLKLKWENLEGKKLNSLDSLSELLPTEYLQHKLVQKKNKIIKQLAAPCKVKKQIPIKNKKYTPGAFTSNRYKPNQRHVIKPNLDAAGNYGKLIYNRPKS